MSPIPLSILGVVFVVWLIGTVTVLAVLTSEGERTGSEDDSDRKRRSSTR